jgi:hypothetical protein
LVFELPGIIIEKIIDSQHFVPALEQAFRQMRTDEAGDTRDT